MPDDTTNGKPIPEHAARAQEDQFLGVRVSLFFGALFFVYGMFVPYLPVWLDFSGLTATEISIVIAAPFFIRIAATPCVTFLADRIGNYRLVVVVLAWSALASALLLTQMSGYAAILVVAVAFLLATTSMMPLTETIAIASVRTAGLDYGRMRLWGSIAFIVANLAGGLLIDELGGGVGVWLLVVAAAFAVVSAHQLPGPPPAVAASPAPRMSWRTSLPMQLIRSPPFVFFLIAIGCLHGAHATFYTFGAVEWESQGLSGTWIGALWAIGVTAEVILFAYSGVLARRVGAAPLILAGAAAAVDSRCNTSRSISIPASDAKASIRLPKYRYNATHGIARIRPISVVTRARLILPAKSSWFGVAPCRSASNAPIIPHTVPSKPSSGAIEPITPSASVDRYSRAV